MSSRAKVLDFADQVADHWGLDRVIPPLKRCSKGDQCAHLEGPLLPATTEYFYSAPSKKGRLDSRCKQCRKRYYEANRDKFSERGRRYYAANGDKQRAYVSRYRKENPDKIREYQKQWREANPDKERERSRRYRELHPQEVRNRVKRWIEAHSDEQREYKRHYQQVNRARIAEREKRYRQAHPEKRRNQAQRRQSIRSALPAAFTIADWNHALKYFHGACAYCGNPPSLFDHHKTLQQEHHIPQMPDYDLVGPNPGYVPQNILPACQTCNISKHNHDPHEWLISRFGKRKGREIEARIRAYFDSLML